MKEIIRDLTTQPQNLYSKGGEIFMAAEPESSESPTNRETVRPSGQPNRSPGETARIIREWNAYYQSQGMKPEAGDRETWSMLARRGMRPPSATLLQENEETSQPGAEAGTGGQPPREAPDRFLGITDPNLEQLKTRARNLTSNMRASASARAEGGRGIGVSGAESEEYQNLYNSIMSSTAPSTYSDIQRNEFNIQKQLLASAMGLQLRGLFEQARGDDAELLTKKTELAFAIEHDDYDAIERVINAENPISGSQSYFYLVQSMVERFGTIAHKDKSYMVDYLLEYAVESILKRADINPKAQYPQFGFYEANNLDSVIGMARVYDFSIGRSENKGMFRYLTDLRQRRNIMHELFRGMNDRQTYVQYITQNLRKEGLAFVENQISGVSDVQMLYEKFLASRLSFKEGWLTSKDMEAADADVENFLNSNKFQKEVTDADGNVLKDEGGKNKTRSLREWETRRAMLVGKSLNAATQRRIVYTILGDVPFEDIDTLLDSVDSDPIAGILAPMKLRLQRYLGIDTTMRKIFIEELIQKTKELAEKNGDRYGYVDKDEPNGERKGLYNKKEDSWALLDTGVTDPKSNGWRGRMILLKQNYGLEFLNGGKFTIEEYMNLIRLQAKKEVIEEIRSKHPSKTDKEIESMLNDNRAKYKGNTPYGEEIGRKFNEKIRGYVQKQRLFLGAMLQLETGLDNTNKQIIWENAAKFLPSRIAAFFPNETLGIIQKIYGETKEQALERWNGLKTKLFLAEHRRVTNDAEVLKGKTWGEFDQGGFKDLSQYLADAGITDEREIRIIQQLTSLGEEKASELARMKFSFTPFLDDVPKTNWEGIDDYSYTRILVYDQSDFEEGYKGIMGLIGKPVINPEDVVKVFIEASKKIQGPLGLKGKGGAQGVMQKYINAYLSMTRTNGLAKLFDPIMKLARIPRSKVEMGNLKANMAQNELFQGRILDGLANNDVISDDPTEVDKNGLTQHGRMQKENDADLKNKIIFWARMLVAILGLDLVLELFKAYLPPDFAKSLG